MNFKLATSLLGFTAAAFMISACGNKDAQNAVDNVQRGVTELQLNHKWATNCEKVDDDIFNLSSQTERYDIGSSISKTTTFFDEAACTTPMVQVIENGNSHIGTQLAGNMSTFNIDYQSVAITPLNDTGKNALNAVSACGITDWVVGQSRDVTASTSATPVASRCWITTPRTVYDIVQVTDSQLKFGLVANGLDKSADTKRPTTIDDSKVLTKQ